MILREPQRRIGSGRGQGLNVVGPLVVDGEVTAMPQRQTLFTSAPASMSSRIIRGLPCRAVAIRASASGFAPASRSRLMTRS